MKFLKHIVIASIALVLYNCDTDIPNEDNEKPNLRFEISGDGFSRAFTSDDDFENLQLNLKENVNYNFTFSGGDSGGMKRIAWQLPMDDVMSFTTPVNAPWTNTNVSALSRLIEWRGDRNNPISGHVINGRFDALGDNLFFRIEFRAEDFGGDSGNSNIDSFYLNIGISPNNTTEVVTL